MALYRSTITEDCVIQAGIIQLNITFHWPTEIQQQYDRYYAVVTRTRDSDPLVYDSGLIEKEYDYLALYEGINDAESWLDNTNFVPQSFKGKTKEERIALINTRKMMCKSMQTLLDIWKEILCYQVTINDSIVFNLRPGGWVYDLNNEWQLRFISDRDEINEGELEYAQIEVRVND